MKNENFKIGEKYKGYVNGEVFEVVDMKMRIDGKVDVVFNACEKKISVPLRTAQELLITKI